MARRSAEGRRTGVLVLRPELTPPRSDTAHPGIGRAALLPFAPRPSDQLHGRRAHDRITDRRLVFSSSYPRANFSTRAPQAGGDIKAWKQENPCT